MILCNAVCASSRFSGYAFRMLFKINRLRCAFSTGTETTPFDTFCETCVPASLLYCSPILKSTVWRLARLSKRLLMHCLTTIVRLTLLGFIAPVLFACVLVLGKGVHMCCIGKHTSDSWRDGLLSVQRMASLLGLKSMVRGSCVLCFVSMAPIVLRG